MSRNAVIVKLDVVITVNCFFKEILTIVVFREFKLGPGTLNIVNNSCETLSQRADLAEPPLFAHVL